MRGEHVFLGDTVHTVTAVGPGKTVTAILSPSLSLSSSDSKTAPTDWEMPTLRMAATAPAASGVSQKNPKIAVP